MLNTRRSIQIAQLTSKYGVPQGSVLSLKLLNIYELNTYFIVLFMFLYFIETLPANFNDYFTKKEYLHNCNTRSASKIHIDIKENYGKFSVK